MTSIVKNRNDLTIRDLGSEMIIYDEATETFHILNGAARSIWLMLGGEINRHELQEKYIGLYPGESRARLVRDLSEALDTFLVKGLLLGS